MVVPTLAAEEYQLGDTGVKLNGSVALPFVDITSVQGLDNAPVRLQTTTREAIDGSWVDGDYEQERSVVLEGNIYASVTALETYLDSLKANWAPSKTNKPFYFGTDVAASPDNVRMVYGKPQGMRYNKDALRRLGCVEAQFIIICGDPAIYSTAVVATNIPATVTVGGNRPTYPVIRINASRTNPTLTLAGKTLTYTGTIGSGYVDIDIRNRTVVDNAGANKRSAVTFSSGAVWDSFALQPGGNAFTVGGSGAGTITVTAQSAWR